MLTIGQRLKKEREARYLTVEKASDETRIRVIFLRALESDDYSVLPSAAQGRGFLRNYAAYLDINIDEIIAEMQRNAPPAEDVSGPLPQVNLVETEIPSLTEKQDETSPLSSLTQRIRSALSKPALPDQAEATLKEAPLEAAIETASVEPVIQKEKPSGRKKKKVVEDISLVTDTALPSEKIDEETVEATEMPIEAGQAETQPEAQASLIEKLLALIPSRTVKEDDAPALAESNIVEEEKNAVSTLPANVIFAEIGRQLRERRELISLTMEEVERHIKLKAVFVKALEEGTFDKLPSTVQTRGMLANYATFLDMDMDAILLRYADALQARRREKYTETPRENIQTEVKASIPFWRSFIAGDLVFGIAIIAMLLALGGWGIGRVLSSQSSANTEPTSASIVDVLANAPTLTPLPDDPLTSGDPALATDTGVLEGTLEAPTLSLNANVVVVVYSVERAFARIAVDGEVVFEGRIAPFETLQYEAVEKIEILSGNAAALRITYNGRNLGLMGNVGEVVSRIYTISGIVAPTSTPLPTVTNTPLVTNTPTATITSTSTPTLEPSP